MSAQPAPVLMHAHAGGQAPTPSLTVTKAPRALHIPPEILAQPGLSLTACAILAEVLDLYQVKGKVFADDDHFAARCRCSARTVRSEMASLEEAGYLTRDVDQKRHGYKRLLVPSAKWREAPEPPANSAGATPEPPAIIATTSGNNCHNLRQNLPEAPANSANINTSLNTKSNTNQTPAAGAAGAGSKKNEALTSLPEPPADAPHTRGGATDVPTSKTNPAGPRSWAYDPAAIAENLRLPFDTAEFRAAWVGYRVFREEQKFPRLTGGMQEQELLRKLGTLAAGDQALALAIISQTIEKGWKGLFQLDRSHAIARSTAGPARRPAAGPGRVETLPSYGRNRGPQPPGPTA